jgi:hypothetical protein
VSNLDQEHRMLRKLIMFAITSGLARKAYDNYRRKKQNPFPTAKDHPRASTGPTRRGQG